MSEDRTNHIYKNDPAQPEVEQEQIREEEPQPTTIKDGRTQTEPRKEEKNLDEPEEGPINKNERKDIDRTGTENL